ncbi:MAG: serine/threonine protein kinase [Proteobacteria bacterium]|nr:serine/threonine protein kinase [Pseudomonadota bacterium]
MPEQNSALPPAYQLGEYVIQCELGKGGFGITYLADDSKLGSSVAIKEYFPQGIAFRDDDMQIKAKASNPQAVKDYKWGLDQFLQEAQALARFKHNHIVRVLRFMELNGTAYMIMEYEEGESLSEFLGKQGGKLTEPEFSRIFIPILNGMEAVHAAGLLHLDIKPDNIYLCSDGRPILIDFGSARQTTKDAASMERIALTPAYAAIEQWPNKGKQGAWTDIFSLGAAMYRCISGKEPIDAMRRYQTMVKSKADPLIPATKLKDSGYSKYVCECIDWAINIYPKHRPRGARELQEGLMGRGRPGKVNKPAIPVVSDKPVNAEPEVLTAAERVKRLDGWKLTQGVLGIAIIGLVSAAAITHFTRKPVALPDTPITSDTIYEDYNNGQAANNELIGDGSLANPVSTKNIEESEKEPYFTEPIQLLHTIDKHPGAINATAFINGGAHVATASADNIIRIWDVASGRLLNKLEGHKRSVLAMASAKDGRLLASAGSDATVILWDARKGKQIAKLEGHDYSIYTLAFGANGRLLASAGKDQNIIIWDTRRKSKMHVLEGHNDSILSLDFSPDDQSLVTGSNDGQMKYWSVVQARETYSRLGHMGRVFSTRYSPSGKLIASSGKSKILKLWSTDTGKESHSFNDAPQQINSMIFTPDSRQLIGAGSDDYVYIWNVSSGARDYELTCQGGALLSIALSKNGVIAAGSKDGRLCLWRTSS